ncbi:hypothetical protein PU02_0951 [Bartonella ancashensis]|uniref:Uncharacterized protein n=1 Tax=Bartonella ancashensis TaxID=1318743 RepID=A0A0M3T330_9HYPH|nr:hypothetical protein PU02_0951 [Bartonella ancashensis]
MAEFIQEKILERVSCRFYSSKIEGTLYLICYSIVAYACKNYVCNLIQLIIPFY